MLGRRRVGGLLFKLVFTTRKFKDAVTFSNLPHRRRSSKNKYFHFYIIFIGKFNYAGMLRECENKNHLWWKYMRNNFPENLFTKIFLNDGKYSFYRVFRMYYSVFA